MEKLTDMVDTAYKLADEMREEIGDFDKGYPIYGVLYDIKNLLQKPMPIRKDVIDLIYEAIRHVDESPDAAAIVLYKAIYKLQKPILISEVEHAWL
jgi:hypothetical protein